MFIVVFMLLRQLIMNARTHKLIFVQFCVLHLIRELLNILINQPMAFLLDM